MPRRRCSPKPSEMSCPASPPDTPPNEVWADLGAEILAEPVDTEDHDAAILHSRDRVVLVNGPSELMNVAKVDSIGLVESRVSRSNLGETGSVGTAEVWRHRRVFVLRGHDHGRYCSPPTTTDYEVAGSSRGPTDGDSFGSGDRG